LSLTFSFKSNVVAVFCTSGLHGISYKSRKVSKSGRIIERQNSVFCRSSCVAIFTLILIYILLFAFTTCLKPLVLFCITTLKGCLDSCLNHIQYMCDALHCIYLFVPLSSGTWECRFVPLCVTLEASWRPSCSTDWPSSGSSCRSSFSVGFKF